MWLLFLEINDLQSLYKYTVLYSWDSLVHFPNYPKRVHLLICICACNCVVIISGVHHSLEFTYISSRRIFRSLRRSHTLMSQPAVDVKPVPREELVPQYVEKLKDSELGFRREYEVGCLENVFWWFIIAALNRVVYMNVFAIPNNTFSIVMFLSVLNFCSVLWKFTDLDITGLYMMAIYTCNWFH